MDSSQRTVQLCGRTLPRRLLFAGFFYLFYFASYGSLFPLLAIYFKQLGMNALQAGFLLGARPLVEFAARPFWSSFAGRFKKGKLLLFFSLISFIVSTQLIGMVQPPTPFCVVKHLNDTTGCFYLEDSSQAIIEEVLKELGEEITAESEKKLNRRKKRETLPILDKIIDLSLYNKEEDVVPGLTPLVVSRDKVCNYDESQFGVLVSPPHSTRVYRKPLVEQTFLLLLLLTVLGEFFSSPALALADSVTLTYVTDNPKTFNEVRLLGSCFWGLAMFKMGIVLDYSETFSHHPCPTRNTTEKNYKTSFYFCEFYMIIAMLVATEFQFGSEQRPDEAACSVIDATVNEISPAVAEKARSRQLQSTHSEGSWLWIITIVALFRGHAALFLLAITTIGFGAGIIFAFLFWHLQDFGGTPTLFGIASVVNHGTEIGAYYFCFQLINQFGHVKVMYVCLTANIVRFLVVSLLTNPWMILPFQAIQGMTLATAWATASSYISLIAPEQLRSHAQTITMLLYHGIGKGFGSIIGGFIIKSYGTRFTFQVYSVLALFVLITSYGVNRIFKYDNVKYSHEIDDEDEIPVAPQGVPMHRREIDLTEAFSATSISNANYGAIETEDPKQEAYDRYVKSHE